MRRDVFVSHIEEDGPVAQALARELRACGCSTWIYEEDGIPGISYLTQIHQAIEVCRSFVLIASAASVHSHQVIREVEQAHERGRMIVPVRLGLTHQQYIEAEPILRVATGTAVSLQATSENLTDVAKRIAAAMEFQSRGTIDPTTPKPASEPTPMQSSPSAGAPRVGWRQWRLSITLTVSAAVLVGVIAGALYYPTASSEAGLQPLPCSDEESSRSIEGQVATSVRFSNLRQSDIAIYWLNDSGKRELYQRVPPQKDFVVSTYLTHPWLVADSDDNCLAIYQPQPNPALVQVH
jgi:von Hippel-Lindau disease tumor supressor